jgi:ubiquinone/menaquinone biosynthesis C-methylase UbiE
MPVFGKGRTGRHQTLRDYGQIQRPKESGRRQIPYTCRWAIENSSLRKVEKGIGFSLEKDIARRTRAYPGRPIVVVDWGCGKGRAATTIAKKFGKRIAVYGFSDIAYMEWLGNKSVKFVQATKEDVPRYVKNSSVDIIYSHFGLSHIGFSHIPAYTAKLFPKLRKGGKIVTEISKPVETKELESLVARELGKIFQPESFYVHAMKINKKGRLSLLVERLE